MKIQKKNKRAVSALVATVLLILITVAAVGIIWGAIMPMLNKATQLGQACTSARLMIDTTRGYTCYDESKKQANVMVVRGAEDFELAGMQIGLASGDEVKSYDIKPETSTILQLSFEEGEGSSVYDTSGNENDGTIYGASWVDGKLGKALSFDGSDDYVHLSDGSGFGRDDDYTYSLWFKANSLHDGGLLDLEYHPDDNNFVAFKNTVRGDGTVQCWAFSYNNGVRKDIQCGISSPQYTENKWHNFVIVWDGGSTPDVIFYFDGSFIGKDDTTDLSNFDWNAADMTATNRIGWACGYQWNGCVSWNEYFDGAIDEVHIYSRALSANEIQARYQTGKAGKQFSYAKLPGANEAKTYKLAAGELVDIKEAEVAPIVRVGETERVCDVSSKVQIPRCA